jgi:hypothetical protein
MIPSCQKDIRHQQRYLQQDYVSRIAKFGAQFHFS